MRIRLAPLLLGLIGVPALCPAICNAQTADPNMQPVIDFNYLTSIASAQYQSAFTAFLPLVLRVGIPVAVLGLVFLMLKMLRS